MQQFNRESGQPQIACVNCRVKHFENPIAKKKKTKTLNAHGKTVFLYRNTF